MLIKEFSMNDTIIKEIANKLGVKESGVEATLSLLKEGSTIPFIARYRKEATGALDEQQLRTIHTYYTYEVNLLKRKEDVIRLIEEKGLLTEELQKQILQAQKLVEVEDLYRPYKEKKKTKATDAIQNGLEGLAKKMLSFPTSGNFTILTKPYLTDKVKTAEDAICGAQYIIAEYISDNAFYRKWIRNFIYRNGFLVSRKKKGSEDEKKVYEMYYAYEEEIRKAKAHRILALNRGEKEKVLTISIRVEEEPIFSFLSQKIIKNANSFVVDSVLLAIEDSFKRLIFPSIQREIRGDLTEKGEEAAISNFSDNLEKLLLQPPMKDKWVLGFDPAYRTGCKLAVLDPTGKNMAIDVIYPHEPICAFEEAQKKLLALLDTYPIDIIAIGNGTASRESEAFVAKVLKNVKRKCEYILVSEAGASVYSASPLAMEEFPSLTVEKRSAISIGRRLQDPLAELVKIDPESIGVGLYQHDVTGKKLSQSLDFVVSKVVNTVGVNVNTASFSLLQYISGLTKTSIQKILEHRNVVGKISSREEIKKILTPKTYEQAIGFLRIVEGSSVLDQTSIHPESYALAHQILSHLGCSISDVGSASIQEKIESVSAASLASALHADIYTVEDILKSFARPNRDPRDEMPRPLLKSDVVKIEDLKVGMHLQGTVRNVVDFGAFIDIGLHNDGLAHISKLSSTYIKHPSEIVHVGDIVDCYVEDIFLDKEKVSLSLLEPSTNIK